MPQYSLDERDFIASAFLVCKSVVEVQRQFCLRFPRETIRKIYIKFRNEGTLRNLNQGRSGRKVTTRTEENRNVLENLVLNKKTSVRKLSRSTGISRSTVQRIIRKDIKAKPYRLITVPALSPQDKDSRSTSCNRYLQMLHNIRLKFLFFPDECTFYTDGTGNKHNNIAYGYSRPDWHVSETRLNAERVCVWAAMSTDFLIGPYFFPATVGGDSYHYGLKNYAIPKIKAAVGDDFASCWFQQDGAPGHRALHVKQLLKAEFGRRTIGLGLSNSWPARSPDLNVCDYFLWSYIKDIVYSDGNVSDLPSLKRKVRNAFNLVRRERQEVLLNAVGQWRKRLRICIEEEGKNVDPKFR